MTKNHKKIIIFTILVALLINYPWLSLFSTHGLTFNIPTLFIYLFVIWACLIFLIWHYIDTNDEPQSKEKTAPRETNPADLTPGDRDAG